MALNTEAIKKEWYVFLSTLISKIKNRCSAELEEAKGLKKILYLLAKDAVNLNGIQSGIFKQSFDLLTQELVRLDIPQAAAKEAFQSFLESDDIEEAVQNISQRIIVAYQTKGIAQMADGIDLAVGFSSERLEQNVTYWVEANIVVVNPPDERCLSSDERNVRRMDSLSRLLALPFDLSVCLAVTLATPQDPEIPPQLVIGINTTAEGLQDEAIECAKTRLNIIRDFFTKLSNDEHVFDKRTHEKLADDLVTDLSNAPGSAIPRVVLQQAAVKLIDAVFLDSETFTEAEKNLFLLDRPAVILAPKMDPDAKILIYDVEREELCAAMSLPHIPLSAESRHFHAEQLICQYLFRREGAPPEPEVSESKYVGRVQCGISKLCCLTCHQALSKYPIDVRGHHGQTYSYVLDLDNGEPLDGITQPKAITHPWCSPYDTPFRDRTKPYDIAYKDEQRKGRKKIRGRLELDAEEEADDELIMVVDGVGSSSQGATTNLVEEGLSPSKKRSNVGEDVYTGARKQVFFSPEARKYRSDLPSAQTVSAVMC